MACLDNYFLSFGQRAFPQSLGELARSSTTKLALPSGGASQRRVRQPMPKPILPSVTHNKAAICRGKYAALFALPRKTNTAAVQKMNTVTGATGRANWLRVLGSPSALRTKEPRGPGLIRFTITTHYPSITTHYHALPPITTHYPPITHPLPPITHPLPTHYHPLPQHHHPLPRCYPRIAHPPGGGRFFLWRRGRGGGPAGPVSGLREKKGRRALVFSNSSSELCEWWRCKQ
jgi:hypothetical protein